MYTQLMIHCHFLSTCGTLCLCTLCVYFMLFLLSLQCPPSPPPPHLCSLCTLRHSLASHLPVCTWWVWVWVCLCGYACMCVNQVCVHVSTTHVWLTAVEWGSCIVMVAYLGCSIHMPAVVIHAVFPRSWPRLCNWRIGRRPVMVTSWPDSSMLMVNIRLQLVQRKWLDQDGGQPSMDNLSPAYPESVFDVATSPIPMEIVLLNTRGKHQ